VSVSSRVIGRLFDLPPAETYGIAIERDVKVPMPDGVVLLADRYYPGQGRPPTILIRSPYGRRSVFGLMFGRPFAERGFQVFIQSCRGTFGSGGKLDPFHQERADGLATVEWMKKQDWFNGGLATFGPSYLGFVQWAIAKEVGPVLKAMATWVTSAEFRTVTYPGESFWLESCLGWTNQIMTQEGSPLSVLMLMLAGDRKLKPAHSHLPLIEVDEKVLGKPVQFWRDWLEHNEPGDEWWKRSDFSGTVCRVTVPNHMGGGWYDIFLPQTIRDYLALVHAGRQPYLTIGPWTHMDLLPYMRVSVKEALALFRAHLLGDRSGLREMPVRIFVMGANEWRDLPEWPPANSRPQRWYLHPGRILSPETPPESEPDRYHYDPADPTPGVGGAAMSANSGPKDQRPLEARPDVLVYTSAVLDRDMEVIGPVRAELSVQSSLEHADFFARLCDVDPSGKSINISDALVRLVPGRPVRESDGTLRVSMDLWPMAYQFKRGHRIRLQVSSGAHPRWARNPGSGEPLATAKTLCAADQTVFHDPAHPSVIVLPVQT
jgi:putative CocE/NonD family hydrolase